MNMRSLLARALGLASVSLLLVSGLASAALAKPMMGDHSRVSGVLSLAAGAHATPPRERRRARRAAAARHPGRCGGVQLRARPAVRLRRHLGASRPGPADRRRADPAARGGRGRDLAQVAAAATRSDLS
jgi:hypothetical protein